MADAALDNAMARRAELEDRVQGIADRLKALQEERNKITAELERLREFIGTWYELAGIKPPEKEEKPQSSVSKPAAVSSLQPKAKNPDRRIVAQKCVQYIRQVGRPIFRSELFHRLAADGVEIHGKDPEMVLSTMLWRTSDVIRRLKGGGYWPATDRLPPEYATDITDLMS